MWRLVRHLQLTDALPACAVLHPQRDVQRHTAGQVLLQTHKMGQFRHAQLRLRDLEGFRLVLAQRQRQFRHSLYNRSHDDVIPNVSADVTHLEGWTSPGTSTLRWRTSSPLTERSTTEGGSVSEVEEGGGVSYVSACENFADFRHSFSHCHYRLQYRESTFARALDLLQSDEREGAVVRGHLLLLPRQLLLLRLPQGHFMRMPRTLYLTRLKVEEATLDTSDNLQYRKSETI